LALRIVYKKFNLEHRCSAVSRTREVLNISLRGKMMGMKYLAVAGMLATAAPAPGKKRAAEAALIFSPAGV
jgi:hypothetical protein